MIPACTFALTCKAPRFPCTRHFSTHQNEKKRNQRKTRGERGNETGERELPLRPMRMIRVVMISFTQAKRAMLKNSPPPEKTKTFTKQNASQRTNPKQETIEIGFESEQSS